MTGWHTLACSLGETAHQAYVEEAARDTRPGNFLRRNRPRKRTKFATAKLRARFSRAYDVYRISLCRQLRHNDIRKGGV